MGQPHDCNQNIIWISSSRKEPKDVLRDDLRKGWSWHSHIWEHLENLNKAILLPPYVKSSTDHGWQNSLFSQCLVILMLRSLQSTRNATENRDSGTGHLTRRRLVGELWNEIKRSPKISKGRSRGKLVNAIQSHRKLSIHNTQWKEMGGGAVKLFPYNDLCPGRKKADITSQNPEIKNSDKSDSTDDATDKKFIWINS